MKAFKNTLLTLAVILLMGVLTALFAFGLASSDVNDGVFTAQPSDELPKELARAVLFQNEYTMTEEQLNSFLAYLLSSQESADDCFTVTDMYIDIISSSASKCYIRLRRGELAFTISAECTSKLSGGSIETRFSNASIGKLPLPDRAMTRLLEQTQLSLYPAVIDAKQLTLSVPDHYGIDLGEYGELVSVDILTLTPAPDAITVTTNPVIGDSLQNAAGMLWEQFGG